MDADLRALESLIATVRPRLHRYCARMVGSAFDGEDVVQEALVNAAAAWSDRIEKPENWLFRVAHNAALDALRRRKRLSRFETDAELSAFADPGETADARVSVHADLAALQALTPVERSSVVLVDVLGYAAEEVSEILSISVSAVKAALHRGRARLRQLPSSPSEPAVFSPEERARLKAYADKFNARDFDALRDLLAEDVRLDLVARTALAGKRDVSIYFTRYEENTDWSVAIAMAEGVPVLLAQMQAGDERVHYVIRLSWNGDRIANIRDFRYAPYVMDSLAVSPLP